MIVSESKKWCYLPIERTGSRSIQAVMESLTDDVVSFRTRHEVNVDYLSGLDDSWTVFTSVRSPERRLYSYFTRAKEQDHRLQGYGVFYESFEDYISSLVNTRDVDWMTGEEKVSCVSCKRVSKKLYRQPLPMAKYKEKIALGYDLNNLTVVRYETYVDDVKALFGVDEVPSLNGTFTGDFDADKFDSLNDLIKVWSPDEFTSWGYSEV